RQSMQGFLGRVNRYEGLISDESGEPITEQMSNKPDLTNVPLDRTITEKNDIPSQEEALYREEIPSQEDIPSQIMRQIDIYRDIFEEHFSEKEISMKLNPESLGGVEIKIKRSGKGFEITFTAEKAEVAELIGSKASELSEVLASKGIALKEMSVTRQIVTNGSSGDFTDGGAFDKGGLFDGTGNGQTGSERRFSFSGQTSSEALEQADESSSDTLFNREAKLWVSA
ncbi:MAG: flagellar hook-length control protein FliK, partial [Huintestinicola sp.]